MTFKSSLGKLSDEVLKEIKQGIEKGIEQGFEKGITSSKKEIVINMYNDKMPIENISKYVDLKIDEIMKIISEDK